MKDDAIKLYAVTFFAVTFFDVHFFAVIFVVNCKLFSCRFTEESFATLIAFIFILSSFEKLVEVFKTFAMITLVPANVGIVAVLQEKKSIFIKK